MASSEKRNDAVTWPAHYTSGKFQVNDIIRDQLTPEERRGYLKGQVLKYIFRERKKNGLEDLRKAQWYLNQLVKEAEKWEQEAESND